MKSLRIWLLILLAFALPLRGAMGAAMLCGPGPDDLHAVVPVDEGAAHADHASASQHDHTTAHASHDDAAHDHGSTPPGHDAGGKCGDCASCCSASIPVVTTLLLPQPPPAGASFPAVLAPAAEFFSGGQERPPRSI